MKKNILIMLLMIVFIQLINSISSKEIVKLYKSKKINDVINKGNEYLKTDPENIDVIFF